MRLADAAGQVSLWSAPQPHVQKLERIGAGAAKIVYRALDRKTGCELAWHEYKVPEGDDEAERSLEQLEKEIKWLRRLRHPHIIRLFAAWHDTADDGVLRIVALTEWMPSGTLSEFVKKAGAPGFYLSVIKRWARQLLSTVAYLHSQSPPLIHRDIKADNVLLNGLEGSIKLCDFGLCVRRQSGTSGDIDLDGTPEYMSPEVWRGVWAQEGRDIWAYSLTVLEMVAREPPYTECVTRGQSIRRARQGDLPLALHRLLHEQTRAFILAGLHPVPEMRPRADELLNDPWFKEGGDEYCPLLDDKSYEQLLQSRGFTRNRSHSDWSNPAPQTVRHKAAALLTETDISDGKIIEASSYEMKPANDGLMAELKCWFEEEDDTLLEEFDDMIKPGHTAIQHVEGQDDDDDVLLWPEEN